MRPRGSSRRSPRPSSATASRTRVVGVVGAAEEQHAAVNGHVEAARGEERRELVGPFVDLDHEPLRPPAKVGERPGVDDLPALDDHDRIADPLDLLEVVRRDDDMDAELRADAADQREHLCPLHRVEPVGRLVEEDELGVVGDRGGELDPLPLAGGHRADRAEPLLAEPHQPERVVGALDRGTARQQVHLGEVPHEVGRGQLGGQVVVLGRVADARPHLDARLRRILAEHAQLAAVARAEPEDQRDEGRLAGAVRAEQPGDAGADLHVDAGERDRAAVALHDPTGGHDRFGHRRGHAHDDSRLLPCGRGPCRSEPRISRRRCP